VVSSESMVVRGAAVGIRGVNPSGDRGCQSLWRYWWLSQLKGAEGRGAGENPGSDQPLASEAFVAKNHVILAVNGARITDTSGKSTESDDASMGP